MKKSMLTLSIMILLTVPGFGQKNEYGDEEQSIKRDKVPKPVLAAFEKAYPKAHVKGYSMEKDNGKTVYEIESMDGDLHRDVSYDEDGTVVSVEESLPFAQLPKTVRDAVSKDYPNAKVTRSERILKDEKILFEIGLKSGKKTFERVYNPAGKQATAD
jgi:hypothetical protein